MELLPIIAHLKNVQEIISFCQMSSDLRMKLYKLKKDRLKTMRKILKKRARISKIYSGIGSLKNRRKIWAHKRCGKFWEQDVPLLSSSKFKKYFRASRAVFNLLVEKLRAMSKQDTNFRKCIPLEKRIAISLYTLGSSAEYRTVGRLFGFSRYMVCKILKDFCSQVWHILAPEYLPPVFLTQEKLNESVKGFETLGFPQGFAALDGCHIEIKPPIVDAIDYHNYKGWYSTVLLALVDYRCRFLYVNVGSPGRCNDSQIYEKSTLKQVLESPLLKTNSKIINGIKVPIVVLGDSAFRLSHNLMKPYPFHTAASIYERNFNYAHAKSRRVVENTFGQLKARFRRVGKGLDNNIKNVNSIIKCCCVLHNLFNTLNISINKTWSHTLHSLRDEPEYVLMENDRDEFEGTRIREAIASVLNFENPSEEDFSTDSPVFYEEASYLSDSDGF